MHSRSIPLSALALATGAVTALAPAALAQRTVISPAGHDLVEGDNNNTIPFWALSSTYQQIHDYEDMVLLNSGAPLVMTALSLRKDGGGSPTTARTMDLQLIVNTTTVSAATATNTFATNLGASPTMVLPFTNVNIPSLVHMTSPNPPGIIVPFNQPYVYVPVPGMHFVWEWRHVNASSNATMALDAVSGTQVTQGAEGAGCLVPGLAKPAAITTKSLTLASGALRYQMGNGPASAPAAFFFGLVRQKFTLPGLCSTLELAPLLTIPGATDAAGVWNFTTTLGPLYGLPQTDLLGQFAFVEPTLTLSLGLTEMGFLRTPLPGTQHLSRIYAAPYQSGNGNETATTGSVGARYGLVTGFTIP